MNNNILFIQEKLIEEIKKIDNEKDNLELEVSRSNALANLSITFIKSINTQIRVKEMADKYGITQDKLNQELGIENEK